MVTLSHEIVKLLLQLCVLVVDASDDGVLEGAAKPMPAGAVHTSVFPRESRNGLLTFPDGSGTARKRWRGCRSPVSSQDSSRTTQTSRKKKRIATEHNQGTASGCSLRMHAHRLVVIRGMQRGNLTSGACFFFLRRVQMHR